ncbi:PRLI-interacting factor, putative [Prunus dulcis]|uniref:PRLI-interacting factor, putative n=1 Tax=Prunus dulcis TaxID=3755 RepID=A0A4Y1RJ27_PRUDU|nr:PRLI-interacting factor, putative [Prunus dulcis]
MKVRLIIDYRLYIGEQVFDGNLDIVSFYGSGLHSLLQSSVLPVRVIPNAQFESSSIFKDGHLGKPLKSRVMDVMDVLFFARCCDCGNSFTQCACICFPVNNIQF